MTELISEVDSTRRRSFENMWEKLFVLSVRCSKTRGHLNSYFIPHVQVEQGCTSTVVTNSALT